MTSAFSWQNSVRLCPASFCTPRPNLPVTPGISWLPTFAFQRNAKRNAKKSRKFLEFLKLQVGLYCQVFTGSRYYSNITIRILEILQVQVLQITLPDHRNRTALLLEKHANHYHLCYILPYLFCMKSFSHRDFLELRHIKSYKKDSHFSWVSTYMK